MRAAIVLAAGRSRRFGAVNKLLVNYRGSPLMHHALTAACAAPVGRVLLVAGADPRVARCARAFGNPRVAIVDAVSSSSRRDSLAAALRKLRRRETEAIVFLADMPFVAPWLVRRLANRATSGTYAVRPVWRGQPGHPVLLCYPARALARIGQGRAPFDPASARGVGASRCCIIDIDRPGAFNRSGIAR
ncbi:MAG: NTP transferase domain-containing protein [Parasphingopyxis sp.]|nr:NTP transferase domain-containing protein [Sphingomonadales bacterium]